MFVPLLFGVLIKTHQLPKVSLELRGVRLENAAPILSRSFGMESLEIGPTLKNEVILVRTQNVDPEVLKANLAKVLNGTWLHRKEGWWFTQTDEQKTAEKKIYDKARYKFFTELVEKSKKKLATMVPFDEGLCKKLLKDLQVISTTKVDRRSNNIWLRIAKINEQSPMNRFAYRAAMRITPDVWMKLTEENPRIVFCSKPNGMQQPFPFRIDDLLAMSIQEQNQWSTYAAGEPLRGPIATGPGGSEEEGYYGLGGLNDHREPFKSTDFSYMTMTIELSGQSLEFNAYDAKGKSTVQASINFDEALEEDYNYDYKSEYEKMKKKMVKVTGEADEYLNLISLMDMFGRRKERNQPISPGLLEKILNPEKVDPLSISAPDVYLKSIDTPNVVMAMNDNQRMMRFAEFREARYMRFSPANIVDANGWFLLSQPNPIANRKLMPDRKKLGPMLRFVYAKKRPLNIEEQAAFALQLPWSEEYSWAYQSYMKLVDSSEVESYNSKSSLRIYGSLTPGQVAQAKKGGVQLSALSDDAKQEIFRAIFYSQRYESRVDMDWNAQGEMSPTQQREFQDMQQLLWGGIYEENTFVLPRGLMNGLVITIDDKTTSQLFCGYPESQGEENYYGQGRTMSASSIGEHMFKMTNTQRYRYETQSYNKIDENNIRMASQRHLTVKMKFSNWMHFNWTLSQILINDPTVYTAKTLPKSVLDEIKKGYDQAEKQDKEYGQFYENRSVRKTNPPPS